MIIHRTVYAGSKAPFHQVISQLTGLSAQEAALLIKMGGAYLGKKRCKLKDQPIRRGDAVSAYYHLPLVMNPVAYDSRWVTTRRGPLLVANKPAGLPTQGRRDADYMAFYELLKKHERSYLGLHHRLDQNTSGLMIFSRERGANPSFARLFSERLVQKTYLALATGPWPQAEPEIHVVAAIGPHKNAAGTCQQVTPAGKPAETTFRRLSQGEGWVLCEARPLTGRTHQIRVHLQHLGMPLRGDKLYGSTAAGPFLLHCHRLQWPACGHLPAGDFCVPPPRPWQPYWPPRNPDSMPAVHA